MSDRNVSEIQIPDLWEISCLDELREYKLGGRPAGELIRETWHLCHKMRDQREELLAACKALARLGIERCPRCEGTGQRLLSAANEACGHCGGTGEDTQNPHPDDIRAARAAINKAEGK